jgi:hypothetical protein
MTQELPKIYIIRQNPYIIEVLKSQESQPRYYGSEDLDMTFQ